MTTTYRVWQQFPPIRHGRGSLEWYEAALYDIGTVEAPSAQTAIDAAREWPKFRYASGLARWPIVGPEWDA